MPISPPVQSEDHPPDQTQDDQGLPEASVWLSSLEEDSPQRLADKEGMGRPSGSNDLVEDHLERVDVARLRGKTKKGTLLVALPEAQMSGMVAGARQG